jgi:hypothetical protein
MTLRTRPQTRPDSVVVGTTPPPDKVSNERRPR